MAKDKYQVSLKCILRDHEGRILFLRAKDAGSYAGYYDIPGGRIEDDELNVPLGDILGREIKEELGDVDFELDMKPVLLFRNGIGPNRETHVLYIVFEGRFLGGEIRLSDEHESGVAWENPKTLDYGKNISPVFREDFRNYLQNYERQ